MLIAVSVASGLIGWSGNVLALPTAMAFPVLWAHSTSRRTSALVSAGYFLAASRGLPQGVANFYAADIWPGLLLWLAASLCFVAVHSVTWAKHPKLSVEGAQPGERHLERWLPERGLAMRYLVASLLMALPPFGIIGWAQPVTAAGVLFPGWGWWGLVATGVGLLLMTTRHWPATVIVLGAFWLSSAYNWSAPDLPKQWTGIDLKRGQALGRDGSLAYQRDQIATVRGTAARSDNTHFIILPESALGFWTPTVAGLWREALRDSNFTVIAGAAIIEQRGYENVIVGISADKAVILYRERMPVPVSMWQPWLRWIGQSGGADAHFFDDPVAGIEGTKFAPLICYEQLIVWPVLHSMLHSPRLVVAVGNGWWTQGTTIVAIQKASVAAWAKLFGVPLVTAFNT